MLYVLKPFLVLSKKMKKGVCGGCRRRAALPYLPSTISFVSTDIIGTLSDLSQKSHLYKFELFGQLRLFLRFATRNKHFCVNNTRSLYWSCIRVRKLCLHKAWIKHCTRFRLHNSASVNSLSTSIKLNYVFSVCENYFPKLLQQLKRIRVLFIFQFYTSKKGTLK